MQHAQQNVLQNISTRNRFLWHHFFQKRDPSILGEKNPLQQNGAALGVEQNCLIVFVGSSWLGPLGDTLRSRSSFKGSWLSFRNKCFQETQPNHGNFGKNLAGGIYHSGSLQFPKIDEIRSQLKRP